MASSSSREEEDSVETGRWASFAPSASELRRATTAPRTFCRPSVREAALTAAAVAERRLMIAAAAAEAVLGSDELTLARGVLCLRGVVLRLDGAGLKAAGTPFPLPSGPRWLCETLLLRFVKPLVACAALTGSGV